MRICDRIATADAVNGWSCVVNRQPAIWHRYIVIRYIKPMSPNDSDRVPLLTQSLRALGL